MNKNNILKQFFDSQGITQVQMAKDLGVDKAYINKLINGDKPFGKKTAAKWSALYGLSSSWLLTGEGEMLLPEVKRLSNSKSFEVIDEVGEVTLYNVDAAANLKTLMADKTQNILGKIQIPNIPKCDGAVYVRGDSMYPLLKTGDIVAYKEIPLDIQDIIFGEMYLVSLDLDGDEYLSVKYIKHSDKGNDWIKLVSYNPHHEPKDFPLSSVRALALVKLSIRMNTIK